MATPTDNQSHRITALFERIERGDVHIKSRLRFIATTVLFAAAFIVALACAIFLMSFALFMFRMSGASALPVFGLRGARVLILVTPWIIILSGVALIAATILLMRRIPTAYRRPAIYSAVAAAIIIGALAFAVARSPFHATLRSRGNSLPVLGPFYRYQRIDRLQGVRVGTVVSIGDSELTLVTAVGEIRVTTTAVTRYPQDRKIIPGDRIIVIGEQVGGEFRALAIRPDDSRWRDGYRQRGPIDEPPPINAHGTLWNSVNPAPRPHGRSI
ncbi:MAG: hypothetical protein V1723_03080 [Candidatus Uhrbacteria bacterium]